MKYIILLIMFQIALYSSSLEEKIKQLHTIDPSKRYILMNSIKKELIKLNSSQRAQALKKLKKIMLQKQGSKGFKGMKQHKTLQGTPHKGGSSHMEVLKSSHQKKYHQKSSQDMMDTIENKEHKKQKHNPKNKYK